MISKSADLQQVCYIDTCAFHTLRLWLHEIEKSNLRMEEPVDSVEAQRIISGVPTSSYREALKKGHLVCTYLQKEAQNIRFVLPWMNYLEGKHGLLRGRGILNYARASAPQRLWSRVIEQDLRENLESDDYSRVRVAGEEVRELCEKSAIVLQWDSAGSGSSDSLAKVWELADRILDVMYLDVADCLIYANSIIDMADILLTTDGYFRNTVNGLRNPGATRQDFREVFVAGRQHVINQAARLREQKASDVRLPQAPEVKKLAET